MEVRGKGSKATGSTARRAQQRKLSFFIYEWPGESADAVPHYQKLCSRDSHIWGIRRGQHSRSAMAEPRPGWTTFMIIVSPLPGKYACTSFRAEGPFSSLPFIPTLTSYTNKWSTTPSTWLRFAIRQASKSGLVFCLVTVCGLGEWATAPLYHSLWADGSRVRKHTPEQQRRDSFLICLPARSLSEAYLIGKQRSLLFTTNFDPPERGAHRAWRYCNTKPIRGVDGASPASISQAQKTI